MTRDDTVPVLLTGVLAGYWLGGHGEVVFAVLKSILSFWS